MYRIALIAMLAAGLWTAAPSLADAQWARGRRPLERVDRWLGIGYGPGYHWRSPGEDSSYYHPYSAVNANHLRAPDGDPRDAAPPWPGRAEPAWDPFGRSRPLPPHPFAGDNPRAWAPYGLRRSGS